MEQREIWLMLAFPGDDVGKYALRAFAPSKNGKCWFRRLPTREAALRCKAELVEAGIRFVCKKAPANNDKPRPVVPRLKSEPYPGEDHLRELPRSQVLPARRFKVRRK